MMRKEQEDLKTQQLFVDIECDQSFYIFSKQNVLRILCYKIIKHKLWENTVQVFILLSSVKLAFDTFFLQEDKNSTLIIWSGNVDIFFNISFLMEMLVKQCAIGLVMDAGSYLRESWNQLDFFIVISSLLDMGLSGVDIPAIKILRLLRTLRPLRFISHNIALKMIVVALLESVGGIFNVMIVVFVVWLIFAIMGVNSFGGKFFYCSIDMYTLNNQIDCETSGGKWMRYDHHFDNVIGAISTLFVVSSLEGWPDIMLQAVDSTDINKGPKEEASINHALFFIVFILIGSFFFLNFFIGVLFLKYNQAQKEEQKGFSQQDLGWIDIQRLILSSTPAYETTNVPREKWRRVLHKLVVSQNFELVIMSFIVLNMIQMACLVENQSAFVTNILDIANIIFTIVFIIEAILKLLAFGRSYFDNSWNQFDFFVVLSSIFDAFLNLFGADMEFLTMGPQIARVIRVLRVTRVIRLAGKAEGLQAIIQTIQFSIPSLMNVFMLLMLIFFMFSILGVFAFGEVTEGEVLDDFKNFNDFFNAFLLLFAVTTGEDWNKVMYDCSRVPPECVPKKTCGSPLSYYYFYLLILVCSHVMLNLFILVIIQQFEKYYLPKENRITLFKTDLSNFMDVWKLYTLEKYKCQRIKEAQLSEFFRKLGERGDMKTSLGFSEQYYSDGDLKKQLLKMGIKSHEGFIYFNELLYRCMRRKYGAHKINKKMQIFELNTQFRIFLMNQKTKKPKNEEIYESLIKKDSGVNPFLTMMNFKISFKTWLKEARLFIRRKAFISLSQVGGMDHGLQTNIIESDAPEVYNVPIEKEHFFEVTSDEEESDINPTKKTIEEPGSGTLNSPAKKLNHLELFEKKLSVRIKSVKFDLKSGQSLSLKKQSVSSPGANVFKKASYKNLTFLMKSKK